MNGATADVWAKMIKTLSNTSMPMMGTSQKRLRFFKKTQSSLIVDNLVMENLP